MAMISVCPPEQGQALEGLWAASLVVSLVAPLVASLVASLVVSPAWVQAWVVALWHASVYLLVQILLRTRRLV